MLSTTLFNPMVADAGFAEVEDYRCILDARADALAKALQQDRIDFASCETTLRAAYQLLMPTFLLELKSPGGPSCHTLFASRPVLVSHS